MKHLSNDCINEQMNKKGSCNLSSGGRWERRKETDHRELGEPSSPSLALVLLVGGLGLELIEAGRC